MDRNTLSHYGLMLVATLVIAGMMFIFSPMSPLGTNNTIQSAIVKVYNHYFESTKVENVENERDPVMPTNNMTNTEKIVEIQFIYEDKSEASEPKTISVTYGKIFDINPYIKDIENYKPGYIPSKQVITEDTKFVIVYIPQTYEISYVTNGGIIANGKISSYKYGTEVVLPSNVTKDGYTFDGWYNNEDLSGSKITTVSSTTYGNKTFYAKWIKNT